MSVFYGSLLIILGYIFTFYVGSLFVRLVIFRLDPELSEMDKKVLTVGTVTGLCESFIILSLVLFDEFSAIGLVIMAKSIVRLKKMEEKPAFYLLGTFLNIVFSLFVGFMLRLFVLSKLK